jgi:hypothetical protein
VFKAGYIFYWKANQTNITQQFCENKDKPKMKCCGKCYLKKQLNKIEKSDDNKKSTPNSILKLKAFDNFIIQQYNCYSLKYFYAILQKKPFLSYSFTLLTGHQNSLFRPPKFI